LDCRDDTAPGVRLLPASLKSGGKDSATAARREHDRERRFSFVAQNLAADDWNQKKIPASLAGGDFVKRIEFIASRKMSLLSSGLATFLAAFSFSQQDDFSVQAVWRAGAAPAFSEQAAGAGRTFTLSALQASSRICLRPPAPTRATHQDNVKPTMSFFIAIDLLLE